MLTLLPHLWPAQWITYHALNEYVLNDFVMVYFPTEIGHVLIIPLTRVFRQPLPMDQRSEEGGSQAAILTLE